MLCLVVVPTLMIIWYGTYVRIKKFIRRMLGMKEEADTEELEDEPEEDINVGG